MRYALVFAVAGLVIVASFFVPAPADKVVFLDVGQGDSILLQQGTQQVLIDGGAGMAVLERLGEELPWFDRTIEVVISTHPDQDHLEGLLHVIARYNVELVLLPQIAHTSQLQAEWLRKLQHAVETQETAYRFAWQGQSVVLRELNVTVLGPGTDTIGLAARGTTNNASVLTRVDFGELSMLLTGDAEQKVEQALVDSTPLEALDVDVLKAGHHGSKTSTSVALLSATTPDLIVISVGAKNRYGHPHPTVLGRIATIPTLRTDEAGSVRFRRLQGTWWLQTAAGSHAKSI